MHAGAPARLRLTMASYAWRTLIAVGAGPFLQTAMPVERVVDALAPVSRFVEFFQITNRELDLNFLNPTSR